MTATIGASAGGDRSSREIAAHSRAALDRPLSHAAEVWVAVARDEALLVGAFQRGTGMPASRPLLRRASGGPEVVLGAGTVYVALALAHPGALEPSDARKIVNRSVRPLLRALTRVGSLAHFFGRDWVSVGHRPVAWVGFAHDASSRRTLFEAFVAVRAPFATGHRASFLGKAPGTLEEVAGRRVDEERLAAAVLEAYAAKGDARPVETPAGLDAPEEDLRADPAWLATADEAIGAIGAGPDRHGVFRVGGDLLASRDAIARLEERLVEARDEDVARIVDETLAAPGVAIDGVRSLGTVRDVVLQARASLLKTRAP